MRTLPSLLLALVSAATARAAPVDERYTLVTANGPIGTLVVARTPGEREVVDAEWKVDDNGRGAKIKEHVELGSDGLPVRWDITGKAWFGAPVQETFTSDGKTAKWTSLDGNGSASVGKGELYLAKDGTPWSLGLIVRSLLNTKTQTRAALPGGSLRLEKLRDVEIGAKKERVTAYAVWGLDLQPAIVLMNGTRLVANLNPGFVLVSDEHKAAYDALSLLAAELSGALLEKMAKSLTHTIDGPWWLKNVRVFDSEKQTLSAPTNVVIFRGTIAGVRADAPPKDAVVVDGGGGTLLPGLFDSHGHLWDWGGLYDIAAGVTLARDPGNDNDTVLALKQKFDDGTLLGPRSKLAGFLEGKSPYSASGGFTVATQDEAIEKVRWYADHGFWGIKIYNSMNPAYVKAIATEAHRLGMHVEGHVPAFMSSDEAIADGYDEVHHINQLMLSFIIDPHKDDTRTPFRFTAIGERMGGLDLKSARVQKTFAEMKKKRVTLDPTLAVFSALLLARPGQASPADAGWLDHVPVPTQRARKSAVLDIKPEQYPTYDKSWTKLEETLLTLHKMGVPLVPGTDDAAGFVLHSELEAWVKAGIPPAAVLSYATIGGARLLGMDQELGSIAVGKTADLYLVDGDPTKDITAVRRGRLVVKGRAVFYPDEIHEALGVKPFAKRAALPK